MCVPCAVGNMLRQTGVNLYHFMWWRVVCDEAHEIMVYSRSGPSDGLETVVGFQSCHRWYVSGTPFPRGLDSLRAALQFLDFNVVSEPLLCCDTAVYSR